MSKNEKREPFGASEATRYAIDTFGSYRGLPRMVPEDSGEWIRLEDYETFRIIADDLVRALEQIAAIEVRSDRRHRSMCGLDVPERMQRTAHVALTRYRGATKS